ncbi:MAG: hypothetical protein AUK47_02280 [Deltaproteobacteria bacterium CG2_30_63_29]|nr:MAG: hypothetical protein AUK47_02280 [Deltaproteobacteria bacterium CG2_30_63_29]PJB43325.1 MAG: hypothetical protein CO108_10160 [Deltaproteobacteria bacterium CG_4_9_14_3_um_filter_63_12]
MTATGSVCVDAMPFGKHDGAVEPYQGECSVAGHSVYTALRHARLLVLAEQRAMRDAAMGGTTKLPNSAHCVADADADADANGNAPVSGSDFRSRFWTKAVQKSTAGIFRIESIESSTIRL